ncbi:MAG TPA: efflux transporter outer membrane subunit [Burkholderiales bacterium]|nr:efflux transporter outer membrane subunit [Burkholderiales bacterium]
MKRYLIPLLLAGCAVGPDYVRPKVETPAAYKENSAEAGWKQAAPNDAAPRGNWWEAFGDPELSALVAQVDVSNQTIAAAAAQVRISAALAEQSRAQWWPTVSGTVSRTETQPSSTTGPVVGVASTRRIIDSLPLSVSWEADLWGRIRRLVESGEAGTQASASDLVNARLSAQATLAQNYFLLRTLDSQIRLLGETVAAYAKTLELTKNRYAMGVASRADVALAEAQLQSTRSQAIELGVQRAQTEHAIAVLIGKPAPELSLAPGSLTDSLPPVPAAGVPADLLERRPDVAAAERRMAAANAQIGVAKAAYFPTATLTGTYGYQTANPAVWFTAPSNFWAVGAALALTLFDGGRRSAVSDQAIATYDQTVANYRGTVLQAFSDVEDNLAALRILESEAQVQAEALKAAQQFLDITLNQYKAGIVTYLQVVIAQASVLQSQINALGIRSRRIIATVLLVKALGGGWETDTTK